MNKGLVIGLVVAIVALLSVIAFGAYAFMQRPFAQAYGPGWMMSQPGFGMMGGRGLRYNGASAPQNSLIAIAAKDLNVNASDLIAQLQSGKSIADIAKEKNVSTDTIVNDFVAARMQLLQSAVSSNRLTQAQADAMIALAKANASAEINRKGTDGAFGGQNYPMVRGGFAPRGGAMRPGGMMPPYGVWQ